MISLDMLYNLAQFFFKKVAEIAHKIPEQILVWSFNVHVASLEVKIVSKWKLITAVISGSSIIGMNSLSLFRPWRKGLQFQTRGLPDSRTRLYVFPGLLRFTPDGLVGTDLKRRRTDRRSKTKKDKNSQISTDNRCKRSDWLIWTCNCIPVYDRLTFSSDLTLKWPSKDIWLYYVYDPKFFIKVPIKPTSSSKWNKFDVIIPKNMPLQKITPSRFQKMSYSDRPI